MSDAVTQEEIESVIGGGEDLGTFDALSLLEALSKVAMHTWASAAPRRLLALGEEWLRIGFGRSEVRAPPRDWRFKNRAWTEHPIYRRIGQSYLAWTDTMLELVNDADLDWRTTQRARLAVSLLTSAMAPSNQFLLNPDAIVRAYETAGKSMLRGVRNFGLDLSHNQGIPRSVAPGAHEVGRNLAMTPGAVVHRNEVCELLQYSPTTDSVRERPVVIVPPQINKYYVMDLAPGRSFVEYAVARGFQVFAVSWKNPTNESGAWNLETYLDALADLVRAATEIAGSDVNVVGVCAGGLTTAALLARQAWHGDHSVHAATFAVTQIDYEIPSLIGMFGTQRVVGESVRASERSGTLSASGLGRLFAALRPNDLVWNYWVNNNLLGDDPPAFDVLAWNADGTSLPAALHREFLGVFLNNTIAQGELSIGGIPIDLQKVACDTLIMGARTDHLVPWEACYASTRLFGGASEFVLSSSGHIQSLVNPPGSPKMTITTGVTPDGGPEEWLAGATEAPGVWWQRWATWQEERAGHERRAPTHLGSHAFPELEPAPGLYVRNG
jgi:polyhydroxyalkanoate synthase subunit PhaC